MYTASIYDFKVFGDTGDTMTMAQLPFDETSGTTAFDATGNGWNGTLVGGASRVAGKSGNAVDLSGTNQYVALPSGVVSGDDTITVAAWVNLDTVSNWIADLRFRFRNVHLYVPDAEERSQRQNPLCDQELTVQASKSSTGQRRCRRAAGIMWRLP